jgi:DNA polymerase/3'-5' exonuclease PolX
MLLETAQRLYTDLHAALAGHCARFEVAGSVRRIRPEPKDIEVVAIPLTGEYTVRNLFEEEQRIIAINHLDDALAMLFAARTWSIGDRNGPNWKRLQHADGEICDLFISDAAHWAYTYTIRTGPGDFSTALVKRAHALKMFFKDGLLHNHPPQFHDGRALPCPLGERCKQVIELREEPDLFTALRMPYLTPQQRSRVAYNLVVNPAPTVLRYLETFAAEQP